MLLLNRFQNLAPADPHRADLGYFETGGGVGEVAGIGQGGSEAGRDREGCHDSVARAGHIKHALGLRGNHRGTGRRDQYHPLFAERHHHRVNAEASADCLGGVDGVIGAMDRNASYNRRL